MIDDNDDEISRFILKKLLLEDDGEAAIGHLAAGRPVTYRDPDFPDEIRRKWPDGRRELIDVDDTGGVTVLGSI